MDPLETSQLIVAVAFLFAFVSTLQFYRSRISVTPVEQKGALTPTYIISIAFLVGSITTFISVYSLALLPGLPPTFSQPYPNITAVYPGELVSELATPLFGFTLSLAVAAALKARRLYAFPVGLLIVSWVLVLFSPKHPLDDPFLSLYIAVVSLLLVVPMGLFGYLWRRTRRPTTFGMFIGLLLYYLYYLFNAQVTSQFIGSMGFYLVQSEYLGHVALYQTLVNFEVLAVFDAVASLFFVYWCFRYSGKKLGGEVIGYSLTVPAIASEAFILLTTVGAAPIEYFITLSTMMVGAGIFILTGSYLYGRYKESRARQTLMLSMFSYFTGFSYFMSDIGQNLYIIAARPAWVNLIAFPLGLITGGFLFLAGIYAIERPSLTFLPPTVIIPLLILSLILNPLPFWMLITMAVAALLLTVVPGGIFGVLWRRMSKEKEKGRGRILGIFFGFLFLLLSSPVLIGTSIIADPIAYMSSIIGITGSIVVLVGSLLFFLGISGRLDRWVYDRRK
jgi:hypothetical protein